MIDHAGGFGVYVHWPFCARICPYCDFNVRKAGDLDAERWARALKTDLAWQFEQASGAKPGSLYFGGGTPSLAPVSVIGAVVDEAERLWGFAGAPEITLEANPNDVTPERAREWRAAGVTRLSLGVQSFRDDALRFLGRDHDAAEARTAIEIAARVFETYTFDLIYALPGETLADWREAISAALAVAPPHLSLYQLTVEPGTAFDRQVRHGRWAPASEGVAADVFDLAQEMTARAGLPAYEVSNHAALENQSRHNLVYWRFGAYAGVGPGAHGRIHGGGERRATVAESDPTRWLERVETTGTGVALIEPLDAEAAEAEYLSFGLRLSEGVSMERWRRIAGRETPRAEIATLEGDGLLRCEGDRVRATADGRRVLNAVVSALALAERAQA